MQEVTGFPSDLSVTTPTATVTIGGKQVEVESLSVRSELQSAMPSQVATGGGAVVASTGDVSVFESPGLGVAAHRNPWGSPTVKQGVSASLSVGYGGAEARLFTGSIDSTNGSPLSPVVGAGLIDGVDRLDKTITIEPMLNVWPSLSDDFVWRRAGLSPIYFTDRILRHCGFYATSPLGGTPVFSAPFMGSSWPEVGELVSAAAHSDAGQSTAWVRTHWGVGLGNGRATYTPANASKLDSSFQMTFTRSQEATNTGITAEFTVYWGNVGLRVASSSGGHVYARHVSSGGGVTTVATMTAQTALKSDTFTVRWIPGGNVTIYSAAGSNVTATVPLPAGVETTPMTRVEVVTPQGAMGWGGLHASFSTGNPWLFTRNAHLTPPAFIYGLYAFPAIVDRSCADLLREQAEAELAAMWLDEYGHFRWVNRNQLVSSTPASTLTSEASLFDLPWATEAKSVFSSVELESDQPETTRRSRANLTVWQGAGGTLDKGDTDSTVIEPPSDEDWIMVDTPVRAAAADVNKVKYGRGSLFGGIVVSDGTPNRWATSTELSQAFGRFPGGRFRITTTATPPGTLDLIEQRIYGTEYGSWHNANLPLLRAKGLTKWSQTVTVGAATGPATAPVLRHPVGPWIQDPAELQSFADWLAAEVTVTAPILTDVPIVPDTRIQKGDVHWLVDSDAYGVRLKVLVMGTSVNFTAGPPVSLEMSITCRVISVQQDTVTLADHDAVWGGKTLAQHDSFWSSKTLAEHDQNPLDH